MGNDMIDDWNASLNTIAFGVFLFALAVLLFYMAKRVGGKTCDTKSAEHECPGMEYVLFAFVLLGFSGLSTFAGTASLIYLSLQFNGIISPPDPEPKFVHVWVREQPDGTWAVDLSEDQLKYMRGQ